MRSTALFNHVNYPHDSQKTLKKRLSPYLYRRLREEIPIEILISSCTVCEIKTWFLHINSPSVFVVIRYLISFSPFASLSVPFVPSLAVEPTSYEYRTNSWTKAE